MHVQWQGRPVSSVFTATIPPSLPPSVSEAVQGQGQGMKHRQWAEGEVCEGQWQGQWRVHAGAGARWH